MSGAPLMEAALRWLAEHTPGAELLRLMDAAAPQVSGVGGGRVGL